MSAPERLEEQQLHAAHQRIQELEATLAGITPPVPISGRRVASLVLFALCLVAAAGAIPWFALPRHEVIVQGPPPPPPPGVPAGVLTWRTGPAFQDRGPVIVDVDGDEVKDLVGLAWRHGQDDRPLHVVAFDRKTFAVRWRAGPFPAAWRDGSIRLSVKGPNALVRDGRGELHVLVLKTGAELDPIPARPGDPRDAPDDVCSDDGTRPCTAPTDPALAAAMGAFFHGHAYATDYIAGADRFTEVHLSAPKGGTVARAVSWDPSAKKPRWDVPLVPAPQSEKRVNVSPNAWTALAHGRVLHLYQPTGGAFRIAGRDVKTGSLIFDSPVPGLEDGSQIGAFTAESEDAFIVANESLFVIDSRTGQIAQRLSRF